MNCSTEINYHRIIFYELNRIEIPCPIQPGALAQRYSVNWRKLSPGIGLYFNPPFNLIENVLPTAPAKYRCTVQIEHTEGMKTVYFCEVGVETKSEENLCNLFYQRLLSVLCFF